MIPDTPKGAVPYRSTMRCPMSKRHFSPEFRLEAARLVLDANYSTAQACEAMGVGPTALRRWVEQLRQERGGLTPETAKAMTAGQQQIQALHAKIRKLEMEKEILKKATALLMSDSLDR
ncbi:hypothetical protein C1886_22195 [Pseudomonas sp. FW300-N1A1]|nr:hypothetical protein C1886_22195 [Pseudomonas sp. FW300-N1A1]